MEVDVLRLQLVDLLLLGDDRSRFRDERDDQRCPEHKGAPRFTQHFSYPAHVMPHYA
ncbi:hypothetical protein [Streptomyces sp. NBC_01589]|uniref:hypothetical protein n=1 Tax=unclassified Streptomyces TaxID=2593676 RepID=UPI003870AD03